MRHKIVSILGFAGLLLSMGLTSAQTTDYDVPVPDWVAGLVRGEFHDRDQG
jgi:hypothetical protein